MTHPVAPPSVSVESARLRAARAEAIKEAWRVGQPPDAAAAMRDNPDIAADRAAALDLAYEEFCAREEAGEALDSGAFCARFSFGTSLRRLLAVHRFLDDHPDALGDVPTSWPNAGDRVGDFLVVRELGRGGFSRVYLGVETTAGNRPVALKVAAAGSREAQTLGPLSHPHLIPVLSSPRAGAWTAVAMPFVGCATLEDVVAAAWGADRAGPPRSAGVILDAAARSRPEDPPFTTLPKYPIDAGMPFEGGAAAVAAGLSDALAYLHDQGIAHRDLKPSNVLLGPTGHPYLLDFNLATRHTDQWRLAGTLPYMAPEQLALLADAGAAPPADWRPADVFGCGVILFELLTGRHPFATPEVLAGLATRAAPASTLLQMQRDGYPKLAALNPRVPHALRSAVERCLALDPNDRPAAAALAALFTPAEPRRTRHRLVPAALVVVALAAVAAVSLSDPLPRPAVTTDAPPAPEPPAPTGPFERGMRLVKQGQHRIAAAEFLDAGKAANDGRAYACAAYCLSVSKDSKGALKLADDAIRLGHGTAPVYANRAYNRIQLAQYPEALADCNEAIRLDPELRAARYTRAYIHYRLALKNAPLPLDAIADIDRVIAGAPNTADVWMTAATLFVLAPDGGPKMREKAVLAVRNAILAGKSPDAIRNNPIFLDALAGDPRYGDALNLTPGPKDLSANPHLCNPIP